MVAAQFAAVAGLDYRREAVDYSGQEEWGTPPVASSGSSVLLEGLPVAFAAGGSRPAVQPSSAGAVPSPLMQFVPAQASLLTERIRPVARGVPVVRHLSAVEFPPLGCARPKARGASGLGLGSAVGDLATRTIASCEEDFFDEERYEPDIQRGLAASLEATNLGCSAMMRAIDDSRETVKEEYRNRLLTELQLRQARGESELQTALDAAKALPEQWAVAELESPPVLKADLYLKFWHGGFCCRCHR